MNAKTIGYLALALWLIVAFASYINIWIQQPVTTNYWWGNYDSFPHDQVWASIGVTAFLALLASLWALFLIEPEEEAKL